MVFKRFFALLLLSLLSLKGAAFCQGDEQIIRELFERTTGRTTFSLNIIPIAEGLTNRNYKVFFDGDPVFVRLGHKDPHSLRIDRAKELSMYRLVEKDGIAPQLLYSDPATGTLVAPFIQGTPYGKKGGQWLYERTESIRKIVSLLCRTHAHQSPGLQEIEYPFHIIEAYIQQARAASALLPKDIDRALDMVRTLKSYHPQHSSVLCHQDLVPDNFIFDGENLFLVDWEYADWGDPMYDLAALCIEHQFDEEEKEMVLQNYFQTPTEKERVHLEMMCMLYSLRDALWYFIENNPSPEKRCDYLGLAYYHYHNFYASAQWLQDHQVSLASYNTAST